MLIIFAYHNFCRCYKGKNTNLYVSLNNFKKQLNFLLSKFNFCQFKFLKDISHKNITSSKIYISFTVDDGVDNFKFGYNIFKKNNIPVTLFLSKKKIGKYIYEKDFKKKVCFLNKKEILDFDKKIVNIQNHGYNHQAIRINDNPLINLVNAREYLERLLNQKISIFCYPYGIYSKKILDLLKEKKYRYACTTEEGMNYKDFHPFKLKRIPVSSYDDEDLLENKINKYARNFIN